MSAYAIQLGEDTSTRLGPRGIWPDLLRWDDSDRCETWSTVEAAQAAIDRCFAGCRRSITARIVEVSR